MRWAHSCHLSLKVGAITIRTWEQHCKPCERNPLGCFSERYLLVGIKL